MALLDFIPGTWRKKLFQSLYQYDIHDGQANIMPDNATSYIENAYMGNTSVYSIISRIDNMRKQAYLKLYKVDEKGEKKEVTDHELVKFISKVNQTIHLLTLEPKIWLHIIWK